jgi:hypothetical protein
MKFCHSCKKEKEYSDFYTGKNICKECRIKRNKIYLLKNKNAVAEQRKEYYNSNKESIKLKYTEYRQGNKEKIKLHNQNYYSANKEKLNTQNNIYIKKRKQIDLNFKIRINERRRTNIALKGKSAPCSISKSFGRPDLDVYIRTTYLPGMTDDNYGNGLNQWNIDHILPLSKFDLTDPEQLKQANHYTNLRAMWATDNFSKGSKLVEEHQDKGIYA